MNINVCPGCLKAGYSSFCPKCRAELFNGKSVSSELEFTLPEYYEANRKGIAKLSLSGVQTKHSLMLKGDRLLLTEEKGEFILKPPPTIALTNAGYVPANEHLTTQIAKQVFGLATSANGVLFFPDGNMAFLSKRFDVLEDGNRLLQEDFAQIAQRTEETSGENYKYDYSYEEIAELIKKFASAGIIEVEKFFCMLLFNYISGNGDAHIKNFSLIRNPEYEDYILTPAYDLLNTKLHIREDSDTALSLFKDDFETEGFRYSAKYTRDDYYALGLRIGIREKRVERLLNKFAKVPPLVSTLVENSFLSVELKELYKTILAEQVSKLKYSYNSDK